MGLMERTIRALGVKGKLKISAVAAAVARNREAEPLTKDNAEREVLAAIALCYCNVSDRATVNYAGFRMVPAGTHINGHDRAHLACAGVWIPAGRFVDLNEV